jgi:hypothetical protein
VARNASQATNIDSTIFLIAALAYARFLWFADERYFGLSEQLLAGTNWRYPAETAPT